MTEVVAENSWCDNNGRKRTGGECTLAERLFDASGERIRPGSTLMTGSSSRGT